MAPCPSRIADVETGWLLRSRFAQNFDVLEWYASAFRSLRPCSKTRLNIRQSSR